MAVNGKMEVEVIHKVVEGMKVLGTLLNVWKESSLCGKTKIDFVNLSI